MRKSSLPLICSMFLVFLAWPLSLFGQGARIHAAKANAEADVEQESDHDNPQGREEWFRSGRRAMGEHAADLLHRAYRQKREMTTNPSASDQPPTAFSGANPGQSTANGIPFNGPTFAGTWTSLGPAPIASDPGQDYGKVVGRVTSVAVDQGDKTGNTVYIGAAFGGVWKSTNAAATDPTTVKWTALIDDQPTLAVGAITAQPGNSNVVLVGTGESNSSADSYYGMGILRSANSANSGATWTLITSADNGAKTFAGLGASSFAWNGNTVVVGMGSTNGKRYGSDSVGGRGIYYSADAGVTWHYANVQDPTGTLSEGTVTSVVFNPGTRKFYAAYRFHGLYESADGGVNWTRSQNQPGTKLNAPGVTSPSGACPTDQSAGLAGNCPIYRAQLAVQPVTHDMFVVFVDINDVDQGVFSASVSNGSLSGWIQLRSGPCQDPAQPGVCPAATIGNPPQPNPIWNSTGGGNPGIEEVGTTPSSLPLPGAIVQGDYNLWIGAEATPQGTDVLVGTRNIYSCSLNSTNSCSAVGAWKNLTFVYDCSPTAAPSHVHPDQHGFDFNLANPLQMYFVNDGGVYRALNGTSISTGGCASPNPFDNLDTNMGSLSEMVSFSQHPTNPNILLGGLQDNGSPALFGGTTPLWQTVNGGDGGFNEIDPNSPDSVWYATNTGVSIQQCTLGTACKPGDFGVIGPNNPHNAVQANIGKKEVGGDHSEFYTPFILDPTNTSNVLVGTCRLFRGAGAGTIFTNGVGTDVWVDAQNNPVNDISPSFDTAPTLPCPDGSTKIRAIAAGGLAVNGASPVIYVGLEGAGTSNSSGSNLGHVFVNTHADANTGTHGAANGWTDVTANIAATFNPSGASGPSYGPYPVSSIEVDRPHDATGQTAYVTVEGFGVSHVFKTTTAGQGWNDITSNLPDAPVDSIAVDPDDPNVLYLGTDIGAFISLNAGASWQIMGAGLPNVPVTKIRVFGNNSSQPKLLRVSTYGRGVWQFALPVLPATDVSPASLSFPNQQVKTTSSPLTVTLTNNTNAALTNFQISVSAGDFAILQSGTTCAASLAAFASCKVQMTFTPSAQGSSAGKLTITSSAPTQTVALAGTGVVSGISLAPAILNFTANVSGQSAAQAVTVSNIGATATAISIGTLPSGFTQTNNCATLQPAGSCVINVVFSPTPATVNSGTFSVTDSSSGNPQTVTLNGTAADFTVAAGTSGTSQTVTAGQPATYNLKFTGVNGFNGSVSLTCTSGLPAAASCSFSPATATVGGAAATAVTLTISTTAHSASQPAPISGFVGFPLGHGGPGGMMGVSAVCLAALLLLWGVKLAQRPVRLSVRTWALSGVAGVLLITPACGGGGSATPAQSSFTPSGTQAGTYTVTVTATSGSRSIPTALTLKVN